MGDTCKNNNFTSSDNFLTNGAVAACILLPVAVLPVNDIMGTCG